MRATRELIKLPLIGLADIDLYHDELPRVFELQFLVTNQHGHWLDHIQLDIFHIQLETFLVQLRVFHVRHDRVQRYPSR